MRGNWPRVYFHHVSQRSTQKNKKRLTFDNYVLTWFLVALALTAGLASQAITLMSEGLTLLAGQDPCHQLILDKEDQ